MTTFTPSLPATRFAARPLTTRGQAPAKRATVRRPAIVQRTAVNLVLRPDVSDAPAFTRDLQTFLAAHPGMPMRVTGISAHEDTLNVTLAVSPTATDEDGLRGLHGAIETVFTQLRQYRPKYAGRPSEAERLAARHLGSVESPALNPQSWLASATMAS